MFKSTPITPLGGGVGEAVISFLYTGRLVKSIMWKNHIAKTPITMSEFKASPSVILARKYITENKKTGKSKIVSSSTAYRVESDGSVSMQSYAVYGNDKWNKSWETAENVLGMLNDAITHNGDIRETPTKIQTTELTVVYYEPLQMKGHTTRAPSKKSPFNLNVRNMF